MGLCTRLIGDKAEDKACQYLQEQGLRILSRNFRVPMGEIDLVMQEQNIIVFVEVRSRHNLKFGLPIESVTRSKQLRIIRAAHCYLSRHPGMRHCDKRFDIVSIIPGSAIDWCKHAFI